MNPVTKIIEKANGVIASPMEFFVSVKKEQGVLPALGMIALLALFFVILTSLLSFGWGIIISSFDEAELGLAFTGMIVLAIIWYILFTAGNFVWAAIVHIFVLMFGGKNGYAATFRACAYADVPVLLFGWIPILGYLTYVWATVLNIIGIAKVHDLDMGRATAVVLIPAVAVVLLVIVFIILAIAGILTLSGLSGSDLTGAFAWSGLV